MAELLIRNIDNRTGGADDHLRFRCGDIIAIMPDGWQWGRLEGPPDFVVIRIPGVPVGALQDLIDENHSDILDEKGHPILKSRRKVRFPIEDLTVKDRSDLLNGVRIEFTASVLRRRLK